MSHKTYGKSHGSYGNPDFEMSAEIEASRILQAIVGPPAFAGGAVKTAIRRASTLTGLPYGRTRRLWYGQARPGPEEMDLLRAKRAASDEAKDGDRYQAIAGELAALRLEVQTLRCRLEGALADGV